MNSKKIGVLFIVSVVLLLLFTVAASARAIYIPNCKKDCPQDKIGGGKSTFQQKIDEKAQYIFKKPLKQSINHITGQAAVKVPKGAYLADPIKYKDANVAKKVMPKKTKATYYKKTTKPNKITGKAVKKTKKAKAKKYYKKSARKYYKKSTKAKTKKKKSTTTKASKK